MNEFEFTSYVERFSLFPADLFNLEKKSIVKEDTINNTIFKRFVNEFWTSKQRQSHSIHEISYRACFKPQLPNFFIQKITSKNDIVYDPFAGRGIMNLCLIK